MITVYYPNDKRVIFKNGYKIGYQDNLIDIFNESGNNIASIYAMPGLIITSESVDDVKIDDLYDC